MAKRQEQKTKKLYNKIGLPLVYLGVILLVACIFIGWCNNIILIISVALIIIGLILYVLALKKESKY